MVKKGFEALKNMKILNFVDEQNFVSSDTNKQKISPNVKNQAN